jgi:uncharacterized protein with PQ loop repeat
MKRVVPHRRVPFCAVAPALNKIGRRPPRPGGGLAARAFSAEDCVGFLATGCGIASNVPQLARVVTTRDTSALSSTALAMSVTTNGLWMMYGVMKGLDPTIATATVSFAFHSALLACKINNK